jgi:hypothetical protein
MTSAAVHEVEAQIVDSLNIIWEVGIGASVGDEMAGGVVGYFSGVEPNPERGEERDIGHFTLLVVADIADVADNFYIPRFRLSFLESF